MVVAHSGIRQANDRFSDKKSSFLHIHRNQIVSNQCYPNNMIVCKLEIFANSVLLYLFLDDTALNSMAFPVHRKSLALFPVNQSTHFLHHNRICKPYEPSFLSILPY